MDDAASKRNKPGQKSKYRPEFIRRAQKLCFLGCTDEQMAAAFGVAHSTFKLWKKAHPVFAATLLSAKIESDADVAVALRQRAIGYSHKAVKILQYEGKTIEVPYLEHYPPDTQAAAIWLYNRQPAMWRRIPNDQGGDDPAPVRVVIEVKNSRIRPDDAETESTPS